MLKNWKVLIIVIEVNIYATVKKYFDEHTGIEHDKWWVKYCENSELNAKEISKSRKILIRIKRYHYHPYLVSLTIHHKNNYSMNNNALRSKVVFRFFKWIKWIKYCEFWIWVKQIIQL